MEDFGSFWTFQENVEDLKQKLQFTTYELEITRKEANEEMRKNTEHIKKLLQLLQTACKERDEAKAQLKKMQQQLNYHQLIIPSNAPFSPDSPLLNSYPQRANSSITESNSFSLETHSNNNNNNVQNQCQSYVSSPVVDSPDSSNMGFSGNPYARATVTTTTTTPIMSSPTSNKVVVVDQGTLIIQNLAKGRTLPQKGKLLQAVLESGPLLQTLLVAGSLPRWRNPPGSLTNQIPPVNIRGCANVVSPAMGYSNKNNVSDSSVYGQISGGSLGICPSSMLDFGNGSSFMGGRMMPSPVNFDCQLPKRQRLV